MKPTPTPSERRLCGSAAWLPVSSKNSRAAASQTFKSKDCTGETEEGLFFLERFGLNAWSLGFWFLVFGLGLVLFIWSVWAFGWVGVQFKILLGVCFVDFVGVCVFLEGCFSILWFDGDVQGTGVLDLFAYAGTFRTWVIFMRKSKDKTIETTWNTLTPE